MSTSAKNSRPTPSDPVRIMLFVAGEERNSQAARTNLSHICENHLAGRVNVEIIDVLSDHRKALQWKVLLTPAALFFVSENPARVTGTLEDPAKILSVLQLESAGDRS